MVTQEDHPPECPLSAAWTMQVKASEVGFDWPEIGGVLDKVHEELGEVVEALDEADIEHAQRELGDLFFASVNLARFLGIHPVRALEEANRRFANRFAMVKSVAAEQALDLRSCTLGELDAIWNSVKEHADKGLEKRS